ncbi:uncharacterized protein LOC116804972 isoform X2 [Drosophila grimshawi]|uniref:uncharacterized protein LOC116804972 isoform X2 n=1 Tax=Drosophila grimshawi TaxID=7222 RepID=UPI000C8712A3|nr:uncharacterized protein LOC116804972 isoform X2 [Drosophila grimshawi]
MWRICNCTQLHQILGGCKRCHLPTEINPSLRNSGYPSLADSASKSSGGQKRMETLPGFQSSIDQSRQRSCDYQLRQSSACCESFAKRRNLPRKRIPIKTSYCGGSRKFIDRLKQMLCDLKGATSNKQSEEFYECQDSSLSDSDHFEVSDNITKKVIGLKDELKSWKTEEMKYNTVQRFSEDNYEREKCRPCYTFSSTCLKHPHKKVRSPMKDTQIGQRSANTIRPTDFEPRQNTDLFPESTACCDYETKPDRLPGKDLCTELEAKPKSQKQKPIKITDVCCKVNSVAVREDASLKYTIKYPEVSSPMNCIQEPASHSDSKYLKIRSKPPDDTTQALRKAATQYDISFSQAKTAQRFMPNPMYHRTAPTLPPLNSTKHLKRPVIESYIAAKNCCTKDNFLFNKMKAIKFYDDTLPKSHQKTNLEHEAPLPQSCCQKSNDSPNFKDLALPKNQVNDEEFIADTNKILKSVKKHPTELWGLKPPSKKLEEALMDLRRWEKYIGHSTPMYTQFSPRKEKTLDRLTEYTSEMQKRNDLRNQQTYLGLQHTSEQNNKMSRREKPTECRDLPQTKIETEIKVRNSDCEPKQENKIIMDPSYRSVQSHTKEELLDVPQPKKNHIIDMTRNEENNLLLGMNDENMKTFSTEANELLKHQLKLKAFKKACKANTVQTDIDFINYELLEIDNIIKQCEMLKSRYSVRLQTKCAQNLQQKFKRNNTNIHTASSILQRKCMEAIENQKESIKKKQLLIKQDKLKMPHNKSKMNVNERIKSKSQHEGAFKTLFKAARTTVDRLDEKCKETEMNNKKTKIAENCCEAVVWKRCKEPPRKIKEEKFCKKCQIDEYVKKFVEAERNRQELNLKKTQEVNIKREAAEIERMYKKAKKSKIEKELKKKLTKNAPQPQLTSKCQQKGKISDSDSDDNGLNKYTVSPWHRHSDGIFVTPSIFPRASLLGPHCPRGRIEIGGLLDALGIPFAKRLDSKFYLNVLQNRLAMANNNQQHQSVASTVENDSDVEDVRETQNESTIIKRMRQFAELPLQLRPGSRILLPLPHSKGGYFIEECQTHSAAKWLHFTMDQDDDSDS